ncbi:MAG: acyl-CoA dehydrogenase family protein [Moraxellaceae bacterium]
MSQTIHSVHANPLAQTHEVFNQTPALVDYNAFEGDTALKQALRREGAAWAEPQLLAYGARTGSQQVIEWGNQANEFKPQFYSHDRFGNRVDLVKYHEGYHQLMALGLESGCHALAWTQPKTGAHVARAAMGLLQSQVDAGHGCPLTMTFAAVPAIQTTASLAAEWLPKILAHGYDPRNVPHMEKQAVTIGMGMTEKQGGSDVRANTTQAYALGAEGEGQTYELIGHKWFTSAPMCDAFLMLAQSNAGLSCFLVPRWRPDGSKNPIQVQRLKNKMGNISNASSEIELRGAFGWMLGAEGRGVATIIEMVGMTRFDCMVGSTASMRQATAQAIHHAAHRSAFGQRLIAQPAMQNVLADLQLEFEGALALTMRMARALDKPDDEQEKLLLRLGLPAGKYWITKRNPNHAYEAMECIGGNGVMDDFIMARLYRDAPINAIWEGSGNVQALDMLRAIAKTPAALQVWFDELAKTSGQHALLDQAVRQLKTEFKDLDQMQYRARHIVEHMALTLQASLLIEAGQHVVSDGFIQSRLGGHAERNYGTLPRGIDCVTLIDRGNPLTA